MWASAGSSRSCTCRASWRVVRTWATHSSASEAPASQRSASGPAMAGHWARPPRTSCARSLSRRCKRAPTRFWTSAAASRTARCPRSSSSMTRSWRRPRVPPSPARAYISRALLRRATELQACLQGRVEPPGCSISPPPAGQAGRRCPRRAPSTALSGRAPPRGPPPATCPRRGPGRRATRPRRLRTPGRCARRSSRRCASQSCATSSRMARLIRSSPARRVCA
mmetsp:Transcript_20678/g.58662  ORF Transcript_20678/g.58662 Transcript_20678/m.58662 type:complete len:224 (-) Transcript_20678:322-993(-)